MAGGRNNKRLRPTLKRGSANAEVTTKKLFKIDKNQPLIANALSGNISTSPADESHLRLLREGKRCDVTFLVGPSKERIQCHQLFLMARSSVFEAMFSDRWNEGSKEIEIPDVDPEVFRAFLKFLYADKLTVSLTSAMDLLYVAQKYDVQLLVQKCEELLKLNLTLEDCVEVMQGARAYGNENVVKTAGDIIARARSLQLITSEKVLTEMDKETVTYLLKRDDMRTKEVELFKFAVEWGKTQKKLGTFATLDESLADVLPLVRFSIMTLNEFTTVVVPTGLLKQDDLMQMYTYFGSNKETQEEISKKLKFNVNPRKAPVSGAVMSFYEGIINPITRRSSEVIDEIKFAAEVACTSVGKRDDSLKIPKEVAIQGIVLQCPRRDDDNNGNQEQDFSFPSAHDYFKITITSKDTYSCCDDCDRGRYADFCSSQIISPVRLEWGAEMEVKVEPPVPLKNWHNYVILLEKVQNVASPHYYQLPLASDLKSFEQLELGSYGVSLTQIRNKPAGTTIIHKIRVAEQ